MVKTATNEKKQLLGRIPPWSHAYVNRHLCECILANLAKNPDDICRKICINGFRSSMSGISRVAKFCQNFDGKILQ